MVVCFGCDIFFVVVFLCFFGGGAENTRRFESLTSSIICLGYGCTAVNKGREREVGCLNCIDCWREGLLIGSKVQ